MPLRKAAPKPLPEVITWDTSKAMEQVPALRSLVAAAAQIKLENSQAPSRRRIGHLDWQFEAWRQLDINGELRFASNRHAAALSQATMFIADIDENGEAGQATKETKLQRMMATFMGGPAARAEFMRVMGIQFFIGGESYVIAEGRVGQKNDTWYVVSARQIKRTASGGFKVQRPEQYGGGWKELDQKKDLMMRAWTPHPDFFDLADSPTRAVLPILREIERLTMLTMSQIDSRLISAGLLLLPQNLNFPNKDGSNGGVKALMEMILEVAAAQLTGAGTAAGLVPILAEIPPGTGTDIQHVKFETMLQNELKEKLDHAIRRLATGLDISPEEMLGQGSSNHWSSNQISEDGLKLFIKPVMTRLCDAFTQGWLRPMCRILNLDPDKYTVWFDVSTVAVRPNRFEDSVTLYGLGLVSAETVRAAGNFTETDKPDDKDRTYQLAVEIVKANPALLQTQAWADLLGLPLDETRVAAQQQQQQQLDAQKAQQQQQLEADPSTGGDYGGTAPDTPSGGASPAQQGLTASAAALTPAAEQAVLRALELAGGRLLDRHSRGRYADTPKHQIHTRVRPTDRDHAYRLLDGAFTHVPVLAGAYGIQAGDLVDMLTEYSAELLVRGYAHETEFLAAALAVARREHPALSDG
jgi:hypothetical protein